MMAWLRQYKCHMDWHDWSDGTGSEAEQPMHFHVYTCRHCGKGFVL